MATTEVFYNGDASTVAFTIPFEYLEESDVKVSVGGVLKTQNTDYTFSTLTEITFATAPAIGTDNVKIFRDTDISDLRKEFFAGSAIRAQDLNDDFRQNLYTVQELENETWNKDADTVSSDEAWDSSDTKIATTAALDQRFQDEVGDTIESSETWPNNDSTLATTLAIENRYKNYVQSSAPTNTNISNGRIWLDVADDKTLSVYDDVTQAWIAVTSGGTFTEQPKVVYVDASSGNDANEGHRISRPKRTIKAAVEQINSDATYGDGSVVVVSPGVYQEEAPIQIQKKNVSIIGQALRSCIVHPTVATQGDQSTGNHALFELNSGSYVSQLTLTGMKAGSGTGNTVDPTLPVRQGWNFAFYAGAYITKSPYIQNCTNFSDSEIDNSNLNENTPAGGLAGDLDSAPTGGGMLIDGSVVASNSPLRSMVADSYTHVGLNGPGILVTNNGYAQCTSSYAFFNKYHIKALNGGQANLAASTTDFGDLALVADGKSPSAIFTSNVDGAVASGSATFNIDAPTASSNWFGSAERPGNNMLVEVNNIIYPVLSATQNGTGWTVEIIRPNPSDRSINLGLDGAVADQASVSFFLRSMIASSGHTMEYVGSGTDYRALPENGGVPNESKQITELNNGKIWTAITDHKGKFKIGGNQTEAPIFQVDQQTGFVTIPAGSITAFSVQSDPNPTLSADLNVGNNSIVSAQDVVLNPTGNVSVSSSRITNVSNPTSAQDAATKSYVDTNVSGYVHPNHTGDVTSAGDGATTISAGAVTASKLANNAVTAQKLADGAVTDVKLASDYLRLDANNTATGTNTFNGVVNFRGTDVDLGDNVVLNFGNGDDCEMFTNGSHMYIDLNSGIGNLYIRDGTTTRFTFNDAGNFTASGTVTGTSFNGPATQVNRGTYSGTSTWKDVALWGDTSGSTSNLTNNTSGYVQVSGGGKLRISNDFSCNGDIYIPNYDEASSNTANTRIASGSGKISRISSSRRIKKDIETVSDATAYYFLNNANPVEFTSRLPIDGTDRLYGFIAEEMDEMELPLAEYEDDGVTPLSVKYGAIPILLTKIVQLQEARIQALETQVQQLLDQSST